MMMLYLSHPLWGPYNQVPLPWIAFHPHPLPHISGALPPITLITNHPLLMADKVQVSLSISVAWYPWLWCTRVVDVQPQLKIICSFERFMKK